MTESPQSHDKTLMDKELLLIDEQRQWFVFLNFIGGSVFFQDPSAPGQVVVFNLVVESAAHWPMWKWNQKSWCFEPVL